MTFKKIRFNFLPRGAAKSFFLFRRSLVIVSCWSYEVDMMVGILKYLDCGVKLYWCSVPKNSKYRVGTTSFRAKTMLYIWSFLVPYNLNIWQSQATFFLFYVVAKKVLYRANSEPSNNLYLSYVISDHTTHLTPIAHSLHLIEFTIEIHTLHHILKQITQSNSTSPRSHAPRLSTPLHRWLSVCPWAWNILRCCGINVFVITTSDLDACVIKK